MSQDDDHEQAPLTAPKHRPLFKFRKKKNNVKSICYTAIRRVVHNHPSGDPTPSKADIAVTRDIVKAAAPLGVTVHDHVIIGRGRHTSLRDMGLL